MTIFGGINYKIYTLTPTTTPSKQEPVLRGWFFLLEGMMTFNEKHKKIMMWADSKNGAPFIYKKEMRELLDAGLLEAKISGLGGHEVRYFSKESV